MAGSPPGRRGQEPHQVTDQKRNTVQVLHSNGISHRIIAKSIGCDEKTLRKHYRQELNDAAEQVEAAAGAAIVKAFQNGKWGAAKYWLTTHSKDDRWRTPEAHQIAGIPGGDAIRINVTDMTDEEIQQELAEIREQRRISAGEGGMVQGVPEKPNGMGH